MQEVRDDALCVKKFSVEPATLATPEGDREVVHILLEGTFPDGLEGTLEYFYSIDDAAAVSRQVAGAAALVSDLHERAGDNHYVWPTRI